MLNGLLVGQWLTVHGLIVVLGLAIFITTSRARRQRRHPSAAIAWVVSLFLLPYLAIPLYLLIGSRKVVRESAARAAPVPVAEASREVDPAMRLQQLAAALGLPPAATYDTLTLHEDGQAALTALRDTILGARHTLDLCTFILGRDELGSEISALLIQQARAGVRVRLLIDGIGLYLGGRPALRPLKSAGVSVALFVSPFSSALPGRTNLRNHRKMVIADGQRLWTGGRNLAAEYFVGSSQSLRHTAPWVDLTFDLSGAIVEQALERFHIDWCFATGRKAPRPLHWGMHDASPPAGRVQLVPSGPDQVDDTLYSLLISNCFSAQNRITVITPYFVPDATLLMALCLAARRGVAVSVILPRRSNHRLADMARRSALRDLAAAGARLWLMPGMVHAKAIVIDDELALAGSANLDERSMFLNYELMFAFLGRSDVQRFADWMDRQRASAHAHHPTAPGVLREFTEGLVRWLAFQL